MVGNIGTAWVYGNPKDLLTNCQGRLMINMITLIIMGENGSELERVPTPYIKVSNVMI